MRRAYFYAKASRPIFIEIPEEDKDPNEGDVVGQLELSLYGTRDAAQNWEKQYEQTFVGLGITQGRAQPCAFYHAERDLRTIVHGDDFTTADAAEQLDPPRQRLPASGHGARTPRPRCASS